MDDKRISRTIRGRCYTCNKEVDFGIEMCFVKHNGIAPCLVCPTCNKTIPRFCFNEYQRSGRVVIGM